MICSLNEFSYPTWSWILDPFHPHKQQGCKHSALNNLKDSQKSSMNNVDNTAMPQNR
jgi:hypothetical protein